MGVADFTVNGDAYANRGFDATSGQVLTLALSSVGAGISKWEISILRQTPTAGTPVLSPVSGVAATPGSNITVTLPSVESHEAEAWHILSKVNDGKSTNLDGKLVDDENYRSSRIIVVRNSAGVRKPLGLERDEYDPIHAWATAIHEVINLTAPKYSEIDAGDSPYDASWHEVIKVDRTAGAVQVNLPDPTGKAGRWVQLIDIGGASANLLTLDPAGSAQIEGALTMTTNTTDFRFNVQSDGASYISTPRTP